MSGFISLAENLSKDFEIYSKENIKLPLKKTYKISYPEESFLIKSSARKAALKSIKSIGFNKVAFDTRRIDQENERNPRTNLQYWHRSQEFIDEESFKKINAFSRLTSILNKIKEDYGKHPEYFNSYARVLDESLNRIIKIKNNELDIFRPQLNYLEQLLFARYRLSLDNIEKYSEDKLYDTILKKDEDLAKNGKIISTNKNNNQDGFNKTTQENIINAIFGSSNMRPNGEKIVERTITITIRDEVKE